MTLLLIDAGNTRLKWRVLDSAGQEVDKGALPVNELTALESSWDGLRVACALVACVAGDTARTRLAALLTTVAARTIWIEPARQAHGVLNRYHEPARLGADRWAALIAVVRAGLGDVVVVSAGTALTVDALTREGEFLGGCILPGEDMMRVALARGTAAVAVAAPAIDGVSPAVWPRDTGAAVATGIGLAMRGVVLDMRERLRREVARDACVVITGGARVALRHWLPEPALERDGLVLEGLAWIARDLQCRA